MNELLDKLSNFLSRYPGLLPLVGLLLVIINFFLQLLPENWLAETHLFLHLGILISIIGLLLVRPLG